MSTIDQKIKMDARHFRTLLKLLHDQNLEKLRTHIHNDTMNLWGRCDDAGISKEDVAEWLHMKTYDETYHDRGPAAKQVRTKDRIVALLDLCHGDEELLLSEFKRELDKTLPIASTSFEWAPRLIMVKQRSGRLKVSLRYHWQRRLPDSEADASDG